MPAVTFSLPIADRRTSHDFYVAAFGLEPVGELASDGLPEPLQFALGGDTRLMLIPRGGFGWVSKPNAVAERGTSECLLSVEAGTDAEVDALAERARAAGAEVVVPAERQAWGGYAATVADPDGHLWMITAALRT
jgi:predicted lactoylglutathione lyase